MFPEFLLRWLYKETALPDEAIRNTVDHLVQVGSVTKTDKTLAGLKVICAPDGSFLPPERFAVPSLNNPGHYQNGGYWPMYTLIALALRYKLAPDPALKARIETLVRARAGERSPFQRNHHPCAGRRRRDRSQSFGLHLELLDCAGFEVGGRGLNSSLILPKTGVQ